MSTAFWTMLFARISPSSASLSASEISMQWRFAKGSRAACTFPVASTPGSTISSSLGRDISNTDSMEARAALTSSLPSWSSSPEASKGFQVAAAKSGRACTASRALLERATEPLEQSSSPRMWAFRNVRPWSLPALSKIGPGPTSTPMPSRVSRKWARSGGSSLFASPTCRCMSRAARSAVATLGKTQLKLSASVVTNRAPYFFMMGMVICRKRAMIDAKWMIPYFRVSFVKPDMSEIRHATSSPAQLCSMCSPPSGRSSASPLPVDSSSSLMRGLFLACAMESIRLIPLRPMAPPRAQPRAGAPERGAPRSACRGSAL
mmetsp:Transcript_27304/g.71429  ORF Transcript_27304/g.71429 Transcript_27304/m.71429 type:complete len:319 (+) Transcript_27304:747-1703(+)